MTSDAEHILELLLELPQEDRAAVAAVLTDSLPQGASEEIERAWVEEAKRRLERVRSGQSVPIATEFVEQELEEIVAHAHAGERAAG